MVGQLTIRSPLSQRWLGPWRGKCWGGTTYPKWVGRYSVNGCHRPSKSSWRGCIGECRSWIEHKSSTMCKVCMACQRKRGVLRRSFLGSNSNCWSEWQCFLRKGELKKKQRVAADRYLKKISLNKKEWINKTNENENCFAYVCARWYYWIGLSIRRTPRMCWPNHRYL